MANSPSLRTARLGAASCPRGGPAPPILKKAFSLHWSTPIEKTQFRSQMAGSSSPCGTRLPTSRSCARRSTPHLNSRPQSGDPEHLKVFANADAAEAWFAENDPAENDPEDVAFEYEVLE
jgi:hypothetical protein